MNKRKFSSCLNEHWTSRGKYKMVAKAAYETEEDARRFMLENKVPKNYKAYKCSHCGQWHIGHMHFPKKVKNEYNGK